MSTIKVTNIDPPSAGGAVNVNGVAMPNAGPLSNRNLIINGAMQVAQRATQVTGVTSGGYRTCDRFNCFVYNLGTWTVDQDTNAPDGFSNSLKMTCTTADASPASGDQLRLLYYVEAQDLQSLGFGTSGAQSTTLSFWVRSNKTGNASFAILQSDNSNKLASFQYSISSADTWEQKTITIPADTAGVINNDNGAGLQLEWWLNGGSDFSGGSHQSTWSTLDNTNRNVSNLGVGGATSDYFQITGVQLELGDQATPFEHRSYGDELARCKRYYQQYPEIASDGYSGLNCTAGGCNGSNQCYGVFQLNPAMRAAPDFDSTGNFRVITAATTQTVGSFTTYHFAATSVFLAANCTSLTSGNNGFIARDNDTNAYVTFNAEL